MKPQARDNSLAILLIAAVALAGWFLSGGCQSDRPADHYQPTPANPYRLPRHEIRDRGDFPHARDRFAGLPLKAW